MDFGQYTEKEFVTKLRALQNAGDPKGRLCERCGQKTKAGKIFGMIICNPCWKKQTNPRIGHEHRDSSPSRRQGPVGPTYSGRSIHVPWVVLGELLYGGHRAVRSQEATAQVRAFVRTAVLLLPDEGTAETYAVLKASSPQSASRFQTMTFGFCDCSPVGSAASNPETPRFAVVPDLTILTW